MTTPRGQILEDARNLTEGDRNATYGCPVANMGQFADLVTAYLQPKLTEGHSLTPVDAAVVMCLTKISRIGVNPNHRDNYVDLAAYAAIAGECAADAQEHAQVEIPEYPAPQAEWERTLATLPPGEYTSDQISEKVEVYEGRAFESMTLTEYLEEEKSRKVQAEKDSAFLKTHATAATAPAPLDIRD